MFAQTSIIIFLGFACLITAAPPASNRHKRQTIFFEDELGESGSRNQGTGSDGDTGSRDTRAPHFGPAWNPPSYTHNHFGHWENSHVVQGPHKFGWGYNPHDDFHGGSSSSAPPQPQQISDLVKRPVNEALEREKRQLNRPTNNQRPNVAGSWNQNQPSWNEIGNNGNANNGPDWDNSGPWGNTNGGAWNGNQRPSDGAWNGNQNNGAWNQRPDTNQNGPWNGNQNNGAWNGNDNQNNGAWNQRPNGNQNNGAWNGNGNQNIGAWNQRPDGSQNNGGSWNNQRPNGNQNGGTGSWNGGNNGGTPNASGNNNGNSANSIVPGNGNGRPRPGGSTSRPRPSGGNNQQIRPPIAIGGVRPPSTPSPNCNCPATSETNPVCGTDGSTYTNPSRLNCARVCGTSAGVRMQHYGACQATTPSPESRRGG